MEVESSIKNKKSIKNVENWEEKLHAKQKNCEKGGQLVENIPRKTEKL